MRFLLFAFCLTALGCGWSHSLTYDFQGRDQDYIYAIDAAETWNQVCGTRLTVGRNNGGIPITQAPASEHPDLDAWTHRNSTWHEVFGIEYVPRISTDIQRRVFAHEMGHAMGLDHSTDEKSIMYHDSRGEIRAEDCP